MEHTTAVYSGIFLLLKPYKRIPGLLLAVVAATIVVGILNLDSTAGVKVLGPLPQGLPSFALPMISFAHLKEVIIGGCAVAMVAFADTSVLSRTYAAKTRTTVDPNEDVIVWVQPISPPAFFKDFRSVAAHHAHRSPKPLARRRNSPELWARLPSLSFWCARPTCLRICPAARWQRS